MSKCCLQAGLALLEGANDADHQLTQHDIKEPDILRDVHRGRIPNQEAHARPRPSLLLAGGQLQLGWWGGINRRVPCVVCEAASALYRVAAHIGTDPSNPTRPATPNSGGRRRAAAGSITQDNGEYLGIAMHGYRGGGRAYTTDDDSTGYTSKRRSRGRVTVHRQKGHTPKGHANLVRLITQAKRPLTKMVT